MGHYDKRHLKNRKRIRPGHYTVEGVSRFNVKYTIHATPFGKWVLSYWNIKDTLDTLDSCLGTASMRETYFIEFGRSLRHRSLSRRRKQLLLEAKVTIAERDLEITRLKAKLYDKDH